MRCYNSAMADNLWLFGGYAATAICLCPFLRVACPCCLRSGLHHWKGHLKIFETINNNIKASDCQNSVSMGKNWVNLSWTNIKMCENWLLFERRRWTGDANCLIVWGAIRCESLGSTSDPQQGWRLESQSRTIRRKTRKRKSKSLKPFRRRNVMDRSTRDLTTVLYLS